MDNQKDLQKAEGAIKFLDYQTLKSSPFGDNRVAERMYRRAERLSSATVLLTNHLGDNDPLKLESRKNSINILSNILDIREEMRSQNSVAVTDLKISVRKMISTIRLLAVAGSISYQNAEIIVEAFDELVVFLNASRKSSLSESVSISREDFFDLREPQRSYEDKRAEKVHIEQVNNAPIQTPGLAQSAGQSQISQRGHAILEVLRARGEMGIRDVVSNLPEYSEKMIQRELADLVVHGRVKKTGSKRWSRYTYI